MEQEKVNRVERFWSMERNLANQRPGRALQRFDKLQFAQATLGFTKFVFHRDQEVLDMCVQHSVGFRHVCIGVSGAQVGHSPILGESGFPLKAGKPGYASQEQIRREYSCLASFIISLLRVFIGPTCQRKADLVGDTEKCGTQVFMIHVG